MSKNQSGQEKDIDEFDYFGNHPVVRDLDTLEQVARETNDEEISKKVLEYRKLKQHAHLNMLIMFVFMVLSIYFVFSLRDEIAYHFAAERAPKIVGQADSLDINKLAHNDYITIEGVTDYRAASIKRMRNLNPKVREYRYFHLAGSRIFLEVDENTELVPMQQIKLSGRVVDARIDSSFNSLLDFFRSNYLFNVGENVRFIQVGQIPGQNKLAYGLIFVFLTLIWFYNLWSFAKYRQKAARIIGPNMFSGRARR